MVTSPIGGFMPIPLAIMPPFMAYQSLLMGDAFGKGFQYGKRKISAMTNEEFNNLSLPNLFRDSMNEYESMIPTVEKAMENSTQLQGSIIEKMLKIIPDLLATLFTGDNTPRPDIDSPFFKNTQATQQQQPTNIRYTTDRDTVFNEPAIQNFQKAIDPLLQQRGTREQTASEIAAIRAYNQNQLNTRVPYQAPTTPVTTRTTTTTEQQYIIWANKLSVHQQSFLSHTATLSRINISIKRRSSAQLTASRNAEINILREQSAKIKSLSNDYRNSNNTIRNHALRLRQEIANGNWIYRTI